MPGLDRLKKRREEYLKQYGIFQNAEREDPFYTHKKGCAEEFKQLNQLIREMSPLDESGNRRAMPDNGILSPEQIAKLSSQYEKTIDTLHKLTMAVQEERKHLAMQIRYSSKKSEKKRLRSKSSRLRKEMEVYDLLANTLSKDLNACSRAEKEGGQIDLHELYEQSRVRYDLTVTEAAQTGDKGNQNERIPVTVKDAEGKSVRGYFTPDNHAPSASLVEEEMAAVRKKYGKDADFIKDDMLLAIRRSFNERRTASASELVGKLISRKEQLAMGGYYDTVNTLRENTDIPIMTYIDTPKKLNIFLDLMGTLCSAKNKVAINEAIGLKPNGNVNRRNAAMSRMAELLGCPELIAPAENMKLTIDGKEIKGTFMKEAKGYDVNKLDENSPMLLATEGSFDSLKLKKQLADLQILDYLCGNPDRHRGNMLYQFERKKDGSVVLSSVCGIDNDSSFGENELEQVRMSEVGLKDMGVITGSMAARILNMDGERLKSMFYGYELNAVELDNMKRRLENLQNKIKADSERYKEGYQKGYLIPDTIKIVEDDELNGLSIRDDLSVARKNGSRNLFCTVFSLSDGKRAVEQVANRKKDACEKTAYQLTAGSVGRMNELIRDLKRDTRFGGSSEGYDRMLQSMESLKENLQSFSGPLFGRRRDDPNQLREQMRETLSLVNDYIYYKMNKKKGEEWREQKGAHEPSRTERRFRDAMACREFLSSQLEKFDELDRRMGELHDYQNKKLVHLDKAVDQEKKYLNSEERITEQERRHNNLYRNHVSRTLVEIGEAVKKYHSCSASQAGAERKAEAFFRTVIALGFGIHGIKDEDKPAFKEKLEKQFGVKELGKDDDLLKKAIASEMVLKKRELVKLVVPNEMEQDQLDCLDHLEAEPVKKSIDKLLQSEEFEEFYQKALPKLKRINLHESAGVAIPNEKQLTSLYEDYRTVCLQKALARMEAKKNRKEPAKNTGQVKSDQTAGSKRQGTIQKPQGKQRVP